LPNPSPTLAVPNPEPLEKEETSILDFKLEFEDELFAEYGNTSNYHTMRKPQKPRKLSSNEEILDPSEEAFLKKITKGLVSIIRNEWLEESKLSSDVIRLNSPSIYTKIWKEERRNSKLPRLCHQEIDYIWIDIS